MSIATAETATREEQPPSAAELAGRIAVPLRLPTRHNGQPIRHLSPSSYLTGRWLEGRPAEEFSFAQIAKPGRQRKQISSVLRTTTRSVGQMRATLARVAVAASEITAAYERLGPDRPWGFADPTSWKCSARFCGAWGSCPGGVGL